MDMKIVGITVTVLVSLVVLAGVLMPVLDDATATSDTFVNKGLIGMDKYGTDTDVTLFWDHTKPTKVTINSVEMDVPTNSNITISTGYDWLVRFSANAVTFFYTQNVGASVADGTDLTVTMSNGSVTATNTASTPVSVTTTYTGLFVASYDSEYDYVMKDPNTKAYLNGDSEIIGSGMSVVGGQGGYGYTGIGSIDDGITVTQFRGNTTTNTTPEIYADAVTDHVDLYQFDKYTFTANTTNLTWNQVIVPHEVTAERVVHFTDNQNALFAVIPMLVIIAILVGVIALVIRSRLD